MIFSSDLPLANRYLPTGPRTKSYNISMAFSTDRVLTKTLKRKNNFISCSYYKVYYVFLDHVYLRLAKNILRESSVVIRQSQGVMFPHCYIDFGRTVTKSTNQCVISVFIKIIYANLKERMFSGRHTDVISRFFFTTKYFNAKYKEAKFLYFLQIEKINFRLLHTQFNEMVTTR